MKAKIIVLLFLVAIYIATVSGEMGKDYYMKVVWSDLVQGLSSNPGRVGCLSYIVVVYMQYSKL